MAKKMTRKNAAHVLGAFNALIQGKDRELSDEMLIALNAVLDELLEHDVFGTEGQLDPRGDHRG